MIRDLKDLEKKKKQPPIRMEWAMKQWNNESFRNPKADLKLRKKTCLEYTRAKEMYYKSRHQNEEKQRGIKKTTQY